MERVVKTETPTIPKSVVNSICQVLLSYPDGIPLSILRSKVGSKNILNYDLFGFNKFSNLIDSIPEVTLVRHPHRGKHEPYVFLTRKRSAKLVDESVERPCVEESSQPTELEQVLSCTGQQNLVFLSFSISRCVLVSCVLYVTCFWCGYIHRNFLLLCNICIAKSSSRILIAVMSPYSLLLDILM